MVIITHKQYSCESYIDTNTLSWVRIKGAQSMDRELKDIFPYVIKLEERLKKFNLIYFQSVNNCAIDQQKGEKHRLKVDTIKPKLVSTP